MKRFMALEILRLESTVRQLATRINLPSAPSLVPMNWSRGEAARIGSETDALFP
jgi:hypothetical protein